MFLLVVSGRLLILMLSWDLLGFTSLFLVFYYRSRAALSAGLLTGSINRLGDCFFFVFLGLSLVSGFSISSTGLLLLFGISITKSAIVPFSS